MSFYSFSEYLATREGFLLPDRRPAKGLARLNPFPATNLRRVRVRGASGRGINPFPATIKAVVPPSLVPTNLSPFG